MSGDLFERYLQNASRDADFARQVVSNNDAYLHALGSEQLENQFRRSAEELIATYASAILAFMDRYMRNESLRGWLGISDSEFSTILHGMTTHIMFTGLGRTVGNIPILVMQAPMFESETDLAPNLGISFAPVMVDGSIVARAAGGVFYFPGEGNAPAHAAELYTCSTSTYDQLVSGRYKEGNMETELNILTGHLFPPMSHDITPIIGGRRFRDASRMDIGINAHEFVREYRMINAHEYDTFGYAVYAAGWSEASFQE